MSALSELKTSILAAISNLKAALVGKDVQVGDKDTLLMLISKVDEIQSGGIDFSPLGYIGVPSFFIKDIDYSKSIKDSWNDLETNYREAFKDNLKLRYFPVVNFSNVDTLHTAFSGCRSLSYFPFIKSPSLKTLYFTFQNCTALQYADLDSSNVTNISYVFVGCDSLRHASIDVSSSETCAGIVNGCKSLDDLSIYNLGKVSSVTSIDFSSTIWGANGYKQSMIDSLIVYSFDRNAAEYPVCAIKLSTVSKNLLTEEEISQITNKGYTIA